MQTLVAFLAWIDTLPPWRVELAVLSVLLFLLIIVGAFIPDERLED